MTRFTINYIEGIFILRIAIIEKFFNYNFRACEILTMSTEIRNLLIHTEYRRDGDFLDF